MQFHNLSDAKMFMKKLCSFLEEEDPYYEDFQFFTAINCTTASEYREELKSFLEQFIEENAILTMGENVRVLYPEIKKLCGWL